MFLIRNPQLWQIHVNWEYQLGPTMNQFWGSIHFELPCSKVEKRGPSSCSNCAAATYVSPWGNGDVSKKSKTKNNSSRPTPPLDVCLVLTDDMFKRSGECLHFTLLNGELPFVSKQCGKLLALVYNHWLILLAKHWSSHFPLQFTGPRSKDILAWIYWKNRMFFLGK